MKVAIEMPKRRQYGEERGFVEDDEHGKLDETYGAVLRVVGVKGEAHRAVGGLLHGFDFEAGLA